MAQSLCERQAHVRKFSHQAVVTADSLVLTLYPNGAYCLV